MPSDYIVVQDVFTLEDLQLLNTLFESNIKDSSEEFPQLGRLNVLLEGFPEHLQQKVTKVATTHPNFNSSLELLVMPLAVEYSAKYGSPDLNPHYDGDWTDLIIDFQLSANTTWPLGIDMNLHTLGDNEGAIFNPNKTIHWRPRKEFHGDEYVRMVFFRFFNPSNPTNNNGLQVAKPEDQHHRAISEYRESLGIL